MERIVGMRLQAAISRIEQYRFRKGKSMVASIMPVKNVVASAIQGNRWEGGSKKYYLVTTLDIRNNRLQYSEQSRTL